jgi:hypothetical protein
MRKKLLGLLMALLLLCSISVPAFAEALAGDVTFTSGGRMVEENFNVDQIFDALEPGDSATYTVYIHNQHPSTTRWYMSNEVLKSLEDSAAAGQIYGGVYSYKLSYVGPGGSQVIYDSERVGGDEGFQQDGDSEERVGLHEATSNLEDYFFLDTLNSGESGVVTLTVSLEGETQGNIYQNTAARIQMNFAVELKDAGGKTAVKTGDENNLTPYYIGMVVAGLLFLYLALDALTDRMYKKGRG